MVCTVACSPIAHVSKDPLCFLQLHYDGCFKVKHSKSAGRRGNAAELDAEVPSRLFMKDAERDARDAKIAANLNVVHDASKTCNDFKADNADNGCASLLNACPHIALVISHSCSSCKAQH